MDRSMWADNANEKFPPDAEDPANSSLSASAPDFAPVPREPPPDVSSADLFAQTGAHQEDLFDHVAAAEESMRIRSDDDLFSDDFTPAAQPVVEQQPAPAPLRPLTDAARGRGIGRGRGRRAAAEGRDGHKDTSALQRQAQHAQTKDGGGHRAAAQQSQPHQQLGAPPENAPTGPRKETPQAVRGDRHATGGVRKPKLTEEELAEKMARIQIKNATLTAAHARAEADAASFAEREQQAKQLAEQRRREERRDRQQMMGEREKNRMRKLKAMEGREWDAEKRDDDFSRKGSRFDKKDGLGGDQKDYTDGSEYIYREPRADHGRFASVGTRGSRAQESVPKQDDFPALPTIPTHDSESMTAETERASTKPGGKSWAEQMDSSNPT